MVDETITWRILYALMSDAVVILEVSEKKSRTTPRHVLDVAERRLKKYLQDAEKD